MCGTRGVHGRGVCVAGEHVWQRVGACMAGQVCMVEGEGGCVQGGKMATEVDGTHPTGMHSCLSGIF